MVIPNHVTATDAVTRLYFATNGGWGLAYIAQSKAA